MARPAFAFCPARFLSLSSVPCPCRPGPHAGSVGSAGLSFHPSLQPGRLLEGQLETQATTCLLVAKGVLGARPWGASRVRPAWPCALQHWSGRKRCSSTPLREPCPSCMLANALCHQWLWVQRAGLQGEHLQGQPGLSLGLRLRPASPTKCYPGVGRGWGAKGKRLFCFPLPLGRLAQHAILRQAGQPRLWLSSSSSLLPLPPPLWQLWLSRSGALGPPPCHAILD